MYEAGTENEKAATPTVVGVAAALLLRKAREELLAIAQAAQAASYDALDRKWRPGEVNATDWGRIIERAEVAEGAIFDFLNTAYHHGDQDLIDLDVTRLS